VVERVAAMVVWEKKFRERKRVVERE